MMNVFNIPNEYEKKCSSFVGSISNDAMIWYFGMLIKNFKK